MTDKIKNLKKTVVIKYALVAVIVVYVALLLIFTSGSTELCCGREKSRGISGYEGYEKSRSAGAEALLWAQQCRL